MARSGTIPEWFSNRTVLITGGTGFMGKILIEKLLRCCPDIATIFLLIRDKKGKGPQQRLDEFIKQPLFEQLHKEKPSIFTKLKPIHGDSTVANLALSKDDKELLEQQVNIVFHMAACVRFDQPLKEAITMNLKGTLYVLELAKNMQNLSVFTHVSTSYCHCQETVVEEKTYPSPHDPRKIIEMIEWMDKDLIDFVTPKLIGSSPNTYAYSKCLTETLIQEYSSIIPIVITRPSIVVPPWKEPIAGFVDNLNGPVGLLVGAGKGVVRTMHCDPNFETDLVPADICMNSVILASWKRASIPREHLYVVNITTDTSNPITWDQAIQVVRKHFLLYPFSISLWYPGGSVKSNYWLHLLCAFFFHTIPAYLVDFLMPLFGQKPFLVNVQKRISNGLEMLQYYTTRKWQFHHNRIVEISNELSDRDKEIFYTDLKKIDWDRYFLHCVLGARKYMIGEDLDTLPRARRNLQKLYYLDKVTQGVFAAIFLWTTFLLINYIIN